MQEELEKKILELCIIKTEIKTNIIVMFRPGSLQFLSRSFLVVGRLGLALGTWEGRGACICECFSSKLRSSSENICDFFSFTHLYLSLCKCFCLKRVSGIPMGLTSPTGSVPWPPESALA